MRAPIIVLIVLLAGGILIGIGANAAQADSAVAAASSLSAWTTAPEQYAADPAATHFNGRLYLFLRDPSDALVVKSSATPFDLDSFSPPVRIGDAIAESPATTTHNGRIHVFARRIGGGLWTVSSADGTTWGKWTKLREELVDSPAAVSHNGKLYLFVRNSRDALARSVSNDGVTWGNWTGMGGTLTSGPAAAVHNRTLYVFVRGTNNDLFARSSADGATWRAWSRLGGRLTSAPTAASHNGALHVFFRGGNGGLWSRTSTDGATWGAWADLGGAIDSAPAAVAYNQPAAAAAATTATGTVASLSIFALGSDNALWERHMEATTPGTTPTPTSTAKPATATATNTPKPPTATGTPAPSATATNTPRPPSATATNTPRPPTATATNTPPPTATASTPPTGGALIVGAGGYATIGAAVAAAPSGGTIRVRAGVYNETVSVTKPLTLVAYGDGVPVVDGGCARRDGFAISDVAAVTIQGFEIRNTRGSGVQVDGLAADRIAVLGNSIHDYNCAGGADSTVAGVSFYYSGSHQRVVGNTIRYRAAAPTRSGQNGVWFKSNSENPSGGYHVVTDNTIVGGWDGIGGEGEDDARGLWDGNATVLRNHISECWDDGISAEGLTINSRFSDNTIINCGIGIANASNSNRGEVWFERNTIRSTAVGYYGNQTCFKVGNGGQQIAHIIGNYCQQSVGGGISQTNSGLSTFRALDNVWKTGYYVYEFGGIPAAGSQFDRNCLNNSDASGRFIKWGNQRYGTLAEFRAATGQEPNGRSTTCP